MGLNQVLGGDDMKKLIELKFSEMLTRTSKDIIHIRCLFCSKKTPSMVLHIETKQFHCFGCGAIGEFEYLDNFIEFKKDE